MKSKVFFVTGIDTNVGKSYATGYIARQYAMEGKRVITQKFIQTGNTGISEDIEIHRKIMGVNLFPVDLDGTTCPIMLSYPASPHLAAAIERKKNDIDLITASTNLLTKNYDIVIIEGAGGIMTPVTEQLTTLDYIKNQQLPVIVVCSPKLGSINHTLLTLEMCRMNNIMVNTLIYNKFTIENPLICHDTENYLIRYINKYLRRCRWMELPFLK